MFAIVLIATRYVSLGSMLAGLSYPIFLFFVFHSRNIPLLVFGCVIALLLLLTHRANIKRLLHGEESRFKPSGKGTMGK